MKVRYPILDHVWRIIYRDRLVCGPSNELQDCYLFRRASQDPKYLYEYSVMPVESFWST